MVADFDGDGKLDIVVSVLGENPEYWHDVTQVPGDWIKRVLVDASSNLDGIGTVVRIGKQTNHQTSVSDVDEALAED